MNTTALPPETEDAFYAAVPCHRIVPKAGGTGGYRWGVERKRSLLELERGA